MNMRKQFLWLDKAGFYFGGPGNMSIGEGTKGSVFFWFHPAYAATQYDRPLHHASLSPAYCIREGGKYNAK